MVVLGKAQCGIRYLLRRYTYCNVFDNVRKDFEYAFPYRQVIQKE